MDKRETDFIGAVLKVALWSILAFGAYAANAGHDDEPAVTKQKGSSVAAEADPAVEQRRVEVPKEIAKLNSRIIDAAKGIYWKTEGDGRNEKSVEATKKEAYEEIVGRVRSLFELRKARGDDYFTAGEWRKILDLWRRLPPAEKKAAGTMNDFEFLPKE